MRSWEPETSWLRRTGHSSRHGRWSPLSSSSASVLGHGGSRCGAPFSSVLHTPECLAFFLRFPLLLCSDHPSRPACGQLPSQSAAFPPADLAFHSWALLRLRFVSELLLIAYPSAVFSLPMPMQTPLPNNAVEGTPNKRALFDHAASHGAPHFRRYACFPHGL